mmetsp:Transcript_16918/g.50537  ORF Transcript_16918/g.50537 Transcript_16918/m.50537 type:complete len:280 (-) Transcript_16918:90-929(-)
MMRFKGLNCAHVASGFAYSHARAVLVPRGGTSLSWTRSFLAGMALRASSTGRSCARTRPMATRFSSGRSSAGFSRGAIVNSKAPPPRRTLTAPRIEGLRSPPASSAKVGGSRLAKTESTRPKSMRLSGTSRQSDDPPIVTSTPWKSRQLRSVLRRESSARAKFCSSVSKQGARSWPFASVRKYAADAGAASKISRRSGSDGARAMLSSSSTIAVGASLAEADAGAARNASAPPARAMATRRDGCAAARCVGPSALAAARHIKAAKARISGAESMEFQHH